MGEVSQRKALKAHAEYGNSDGWKDGEARRRGIVDMAG
jgi:hypothetical protein